MPIKDELRDNLASGTRLVGSYKGNKYLCVVTDETVGEGDEAKTSQVFVVDPVGSFGGGTYKSPSSAASGFMEGKSRADGWKFWSVEGEEPAVRERKPKAEKPVKEPKAKKEKAPAKPKAAAKTAKSTKAKAEKPARNSKRNIKGTHDLLSARNGRYFCAGCLDYFDYDGDGDPSDCPAGHVASLNAQAAEFNVEPTTEPEVQPGDDEVDVLLPPVEA